MSKSGLVVAAALTLAPAMAMAKMPAHDGYSHFAPTKAEQAQMLNAADKACLAAALKAPNESARIDCNAATYRRIDARLNAAYRGAVKSLPKAKSAALKFEQKAWLASQNKVCASGDAKQLNRESVSYRAAMSDCSLAELYRRTIWVEHYR